MRGKKVVRVVVIAGGVVAGSALALALYNYVSATRVTHQTDLIDERTLRARPAHSKRRRSGTPNRDGSFAHDGWPPAVILN